MPNDNAPLTNAERALLAAAYARMQRRLYDAVDSAFVTAIHFNTPAAMAEVMTDAERPVLVVLAIGEDETRNLRARLGGDYEVLSEKGLGMKPTPQPMGHPLHKRKKATKKGPKTDG